MGRSAGVELIGLIGSEEIVPLLLYYVNNGLQCWHIPLIPNTMSADCSIGGLQRQRNPAP
jgi:hypothetical protein